MHFPVKRRSLCVGRCDVGFVPWEAFDVDWVIELLDGVEVDARVFEVAMVGEGHIQRIKLLLLTTEWVCLRATFLNTL